MANIYKSKNNDFNKPSEEPIMNWNNENDDKKYNLNASNSKLKFVQINNNNISHDADSKNSFYNMNIGSK